MLTFTVILPNCLPSVQAVYGSLQVDARQENQYLCPVIGLSKLAGEVHVVYGRMYVETSRTNAVNADHYSHSA